MGFLGALKGLGRVGRTVAGAVSGIAVGGGTPDFIAQPDTLTDEVRGVIVALTALIGAVTGLITALRAEKKKV